MLNPFKPLEHDYECVDAAKAGVFPAGWIALSYVIVYVASMFVRGKAPMVYVAEGVVCILAIGLAGFLAWRLWTRQSLWVSIAILAWLLVEFVGSFVVHTVGIGGGLVMTLIAAACGILSVRGAWKLRRLRALGPAVDPTVFD
ncbi:MAG: hypothetical protein GC201_04620 [Alphaproteobacteria bacterium]|nr:hypothetical protein [Alphaproteobacteria bacterium]